MAILDRAPGADFHYERPRLGDGWRTLRHAKREGRRWLVLLAGMSALAPEEGRPW